MRNLLKKVITILKDNQINFLCYLSIIKIICRLLVHLKLIINLILAKIKKKYKNLSLKNAINLIISKIIKFKVYKKVTNNLILIFNL